MVARAQYKSLFTAAQQCAPLSINITVLGAFYAQLRFRRVGLYAVDVHRRVAENEPAAWGPTAGLDVRVVRQFYRNVFRVHRLAADKHGPQLKFTLDVAFGLTQINVTTGRRKTIQRSRTLLYYEI